jgi:hypothetical protein
MLGIRSHRPRQRACAASAAGMRWAGAHPAQPVRPSPTTQAGAPAQLGAADASVPARQLDYEPTGKARARYREALCAASRTRMLEKGVTAGAIGAGRCAGRRRQRLRGARVRRYRWHLRHHRRRTGQAQPAGVGSRTRTSRNDAGTLHVCAHGLYRADYDRAAHGLCYVTYCRAAHGYFTDPPNDATNVSYHEQLHVSGTARNIPDEYQLDVFLQFLGQQRYYAAGDPRTNAPLTSGHWSATIYIGDSGAITL